LTKGFDADLGEVEGFAFVDIVYPELAVLRFDLNGQVP
jgi:hypothetical protein